MPRLSRFAKPVLVVLAVAAVAWIAASALIFHGTPGWGYDFEAYLLAAQRLARGESIYLPWTLEGPFRPGPYGLYLYAPPLAVALLPLTAISVPGATLAWFAIRVALLFVGIAAMPVRRAVRLVILVLAAVSEPVLTDLNLGNVSIVVFALASIAWQLIDRWPAAVALGTAITLRPTFGLFLGWWLIRRRRRPLVIAIVTLAVLGLATLPFVDLSTYVDYVALLRNLSDVTGVPNNMDIGSTLTRAGVPVGTANLAVIGGYAAALVAVLFALRRDREVSYLVTVGATLLLSPLLWDHYLVLAFLPAAFLLERGHWLGLVLGLALLFWLPPIGVPVVAAVAMIAPFFAPARRAVATAESGASR